MSGFLSLTVIFWCYDYPFSSPCKNSFISWLLPYLFAAVAQSYLKSWLPGLSSQQVCWIKHNPQLLGCAFFPVNIEFPAWVVCEPLQVTSVFQGFSSSTLHRQDLINKYLLSSYFLPGTVKIIGEWVVKP